MSGNPETPEARPLAQRLYEVERECRRLRRLSVWLLGIVGVLLGLGVAMVFISARHGVPGTVAEVVAARQFVLRGRDGKIRGIWGTQDDGSVRLVLQDAQARQRTKIDLLGDGAAGLTFADTAGQPRAVFAYLPDQGPSLVFADRAGRSRSVLGVSDEGANLVFADGGGSTRAGLGVDRRGVGTFTLVDQAGRDLAQPEPEPEPAPVEPDTAPTPPARNPGTRR